MIARVVPVADAQYLGLTRANFDCQDLETFLDRVFSGTTAIFEDADSLVDLTHAAKGRSSTAEILEWQISGKLRRTASLKDIRRLDQLCFCLDEVRQIVGENRENGLHRLTSVADILGTNLDAIKRLVSGVNGGPWIAVTEPDVSQGIYGKAYVSSAKIQKFTDRHMTIGLIGRAIRIHSRIAKRVLDANGVEAIVDPAWLGTGVYSRSDVGAQAENLRQAAEQIGIEHQSGRSESKASTIGTNFANRSETGESDASFLM